jgi:hypothetical protein
VKRLRTKIALSLLGHEVTEQSKARISQAKVGKQHSQETKNRMSQAQKARWNRRKQSVL